MALVASRVGKLNTGRRSVVYRDASGATMDAVVVAAGSVSGLKLQVGSLRVAGVALSVKDNVALATTRTDTNVYFNRLQ